MRSKRNRLISGELRLINRRTLLPGTPVGMGLPSRKLESGIVGMDDAVF
jgi:hypothetical protein